MKLKKFFAKLMGFEELTAEEPIEKEIEKALEAEPKIPEAEEMIKAPNEPIEDPTQKPFSEKEMEEALKPLDEAREKAKEESVRIPGDQDF